MSILQLTFGSNALAVSANPGVVNVAGARGDTLSSSVQANPTQGGGTYSWAWISGGTNITLSNTTSATVNLSSSTTAGSFDITRTGTLRCTYTLSGNSVTVDVSVTFFWAANPV